MGHSGFKLINTIDRKARLAGSNRIELLLFALGGREPYGINEINLALTEQSSASTHLAHSVERIARMA